MLNCRLKVISPYNHGSSKCERKIKTISDIIVKHLWDKGQMWPLFATTAVYTINTHVDTAIDKTHYRLKDATGLLLDGTYHVNRIKKGSVCTLQGIVDTFDGYQKALKNTLLNKLAIETPNNKIQEVTLKDGSKDINYVPGTIMDYASINS